MIAVRPRDETVRVTLVTIVSAMAVATATHAWIAGPLFGMLIILRFALQPPGSYPLSRRRRIGLAFVGCAALACLVWAVGVRIAHWPG